MTAFVNYSKYINYCEISINCFTSKCSVKISKSCSFFDNYIWFRICLREWREDRKNNCARWGWRWGTKPVGAGWGWGTRSVEMGCGCGQCCGNGVRMGTTNCRRAGLYRKHALAAGPTSRSHDGRPFWVRTVRRPLQRWDEDGRLSRVNISTVSRAWCARVLSCCDMKNSPDAFRLTSKRCWRAGDHESRRRWY